MAHFDRKTKIAFTVFHKLIAKSVLHQLLSLGGKTRMTTRFILFMIILLSTGLQKTLAQQEPQYTQYMFNTVSVNPAYAGSRDALNVLLLSRLQWLGMEGAPRTYDFTIHAPISKYKMGVGLSLVSDSYGPVSNQYLNLSYAYRINLTEKTVLSMGIKGGLYNYHVNLTGLDFGEAGAFINENPEQKFLPNAGMGLYLFSDRYYVGASVPRLIQTELNGEQMTAGTLGDLKRHYYLMGGLVFDLSNDLKLKPSLINRFVEGAPASTDFTAQLIIRDTYWAGVTYRHDEATAILASLQVNKQLMIGYSYDFQSSELSTFNNGSHEIVISYDFAGFSREKVVSPRYF
ncbi:MAG: PorP/SprF family type IX secretion system membrane protein [Bacteroidota bacterium]